MKVGLLIFYVCILISLRINSMNREPFSRELAFAASAADEGSQSMTSRRVASPDELCDRALVVYMRRVDSDLARHIKPHLTSAILEASSSPENEDDASPSPKRVMRTWMHHPESVQSTPQAELNEIVLAAVDKAFKEKEAELAHKNAKIEGMFSKKSMALISTVIGGLSTLITALVSIYATKDNCSK